MFNIGDTVIFKRSLTKGIIKSKIKNHYLVEFNEPIKIRKIQPILFLDELIGKSDKEIELKSALFLEDGTIEPEYQLYQDYCIEKSSL